MTDCLDMNLVIICFYDSPHFIKIRDIDQGGVFKIIFLSSLTKPIQL